MARTDLLILVNPLSGTASIGAKKQLIDYAIKQAKEAGFTPEAVLTERAGHATELSRSAVQAGMSRVLAIGGDGTINETASALLHRPTALGIVPLGSGNGLARHLGVPLQPRQAIQRAVNGKPVLIDSGLLNEHTFFCAAGTGFEAHVAHLFAKQPIRGLMSYLRVAYGAFWRYQPERYWINGEEQTLFSLTVANAGQFGNNAWIAPKANIADGWLDLCQLKPFPKQVIGKLAWRLFNKTLDQSPHVVTNRFQTLTIKGEKPLSIHIDGEPIELKTDSISVKVVPSSLLVIL
ncbi:diacylglycerol/lipid kinase family protein [Tellurirhabdus bombi]|uniref:diacylglycerol/lipid kinase family protein n=1 Tax=Tellurirhabdus bombi TaxID=2907205 RepID=UPI00286E44E8|nr:diacylglycerol kinase family protein [Tellurirhabdus bombi]